MKRLIPLLVLLISTHFLFAQQTTTPAEPQAAYLRMPTIPPFNLLKIDSSTYLTREDIKKNHRTIIMFFSPDCDHCKHQTKDIMESIDKFKDIEIVMATYQPFAEMREFYKNFHLADHPNIKIGRDEKFFLPPFYRIKNLPFMALYDKKGNLLTTFEGTQKVDTLLNGFAKKEN
jgi:thioredoxin-related protein